MIDDPVELVVAFILVLIMVIYEEFDQ